MKVDKEYLDKVAKFLKTDGCAFAETRQTDCGRYYIVAEFNHGSSVAGMIRHAMDMTEKYDCPILPAYENTNGKL